MHVSAKSTYWTTRTFYFPHTNNTGFGNTTREESSLATTLKCIRCAMLSHCSSRQSVAFLIRLQRELLSYFQLDLLLTRSIRAYLAGKKAPHLPFLHVF